MKMEIFETGDLFATLSNRGIPIIHQVQDDGTFKDVTAEYHRAEIKHRVGPKLKPEVKRRILDRRLPPA